MDDVWNLIIADMQQRHDVGIQRYGKPVSAMDTREDWLQHAYEEALDLVVYLRAEIERRKNVSTRYIGVDPAKPGTDKTICSLVYVGEFPTSFPDYEEWSKRE